MVRLAVDSFVKQPLGGAAVGTTASVGQRTVGRGGGASLWPRRIVAEYADTETSPTIQHTHHAAGLGGRGGSLPLENMICCDIDKNGGFTSPDGTLETREYYCHNYRGDVAVRITDTGEWLETVQYAAYGVPFAQPAGDTDGDGDADQADLGNILSWISSGYDVTGDLDLDGDVDAADSSLFSTTTLGRGVLSGDDEYQHFGYTGHRHDEATPILVHARHRVLHAELGRWTRRDPLGYVDGMSLYTYARLNPVISTDPDGLVACNPEAPCILDAMFNEEAQPYLAAAYQMCDGRLGFTCSRDNGEIIVGNSTKNVCNGSCAETVPESVSLAPFNVSGAVVIVFCIDHIEGSPPNCTCGASDTNLRTIAKHEAIRAWHMCNPNLPYDPNDFIESVRWQLFDMCSAIASFSLIKPDICPKDDASTCCENLCKDDRWRGFQFDSQTQCEAACEMVHSKCVGWVPDPQHPAQIGSPHGDGNDGSGGPSVPAQQHGLGGGG